MTTAPDGHPERIAAVIRSGDVVALRELLNAVPGLATSTIDGRSLLHVATDWPGNFARVEETISVLVAAGADVNARFSGANRETPLHWAASSDDVTAVDALLDHGADIDADGAVIGGGTPLADATAFGQWRAARRLVERGAAVSLWDAAALGLVDRVRDHVSETITAEEITQAFWGACHGGQRATAELLLGLGADPTWVGWDDLTPLGAARRSGATDLVDWLESLGDATPAT